MKLVTRLVVAVVSTCLLVSSFSPIATAAGEKEGGNCRKEDARVSVGGKDLECVSSNGKLSWTLIKKIPQAPIPPGTISSSSPGSHSSNWVKWDKSKCELVATPAPNSFPWRADLRSTPGLRIGWATQNEGIAVVDLANAGVKANVGTAGAEYLFANYAVPDGAKLIDGINSMVARKADVVASWNLTAPTMANMMSIYTKACIPVIQVSARAPGAVLFGPDNALVGQIQGKGLIAFAKKRNWDRAGSVPLTALAVINPTSGASVNQRPTECVAAIKKAFPSVIVKELTVLNQTTAEGRIKMTDWLTANPGARRLLACTEADTTAFGIASAADARKRFAGVGGVGGSKNPGGTFVGTVDFGFINYGSWIVPLAQDLAAGRPVPAELAPALRFANTN